ncbi:protein adenylyltransferase SelO [Cohaesibacter celericrescens]|uniref:protein adenylyltransferase SelO n=1 Tax=Cohaesibacter celericrescens TaxID=2067669 RepID=UPI003567515B
MTSSIDSKASFPFDNSYARELTGFYAPWEGTKAPSPHILLFNEPLAEQLRLEQATSDPDLASYLSGGLVPDGATPLAQVYAGHQFGGFSPQLGDGRALLLGELLDKDGNRFDIHLKGSGPTPFSRGGDGKAVLGPVLREYLMGEAMHALGVPTTRALAAVATGEQVMREGAKPGAVLARVASSHLRVGTFQFFASRQDWDHVKQLADYAIARHDPDLIDRGDKYLAFLTAVAKRQSKLIAQWMQIGFIHGVMNTDNVAISGETIDYGPCAFMDHYDQSTVFSSIDHTGRYAYGNQPVIARWNLARLAETLVPLIDPDDQDNAINLATDVLADFVTMQKQAWLDGMRSKIGLATSQESDEALIKSLLDSMKGQEVDFTLCFRRLSDAALGQEDDLKALFDDDEKLATWLEGWRQRLAQEKRDPQTIAAAMNAVNPIYIPRNHLVEEALSAAEDAGNLIPFKQLLARVTQPFTRHAGFETYERPAPSGYGPYRTFCGT